MKITSILMIVLGLFKIGGGTITQLVCNNRLGVENGNITLEQLSASSEWDENVTTVEKGRLNAQIPTDENYYKAWGWCARKDDIDGWIQVDLAETKQLTGIITQGAEGTHFGKWLKSYYVSHSVTGADFETIKTKNGDNMIFLANDDAQSEVTNPLNVTVYTRFIRIHPVTCKRICCLRFEVLGCPVSSPTTLQTMNEDNRNDILWSWIPAQESYLLQQLKNLSGDSVKKEYQNSYSKAFWIGNITVIDFNVIIGTNESVTASVHVPQNNGNFVVVIIYIGSNGFVDAPFDTTTIASGNVNTSTISGLLSISIYEGNKTITDASVEYSLSVAPLNESSIDDARICGFYNTTTRKWSASGCKVLNVTVEVVWCYCSHLTSFAVLLQVPNDEVTEEPILSRITYSGVILSIVFLIVTLLIICGIRDLRDSERYLILRHLAIALLSVNIFFALLDIDLRNSPALCGVLAGCLHYSLLAAFSWMLIMSTDLYMKIRHPFMNHEKRFWYSRFAAWIGPIIVVGLTAALTRKNYASDNKCWLDFCSGAIWTFIVPVCTVLLIVPTQLIFIGYVVFKKSRLPNQAENEKKILERMRTMLWRITLLTPSVGVMWLFGIIVVFNDSDAIEYIFVILNSSQGLLVFLSQCVFSQEVRTALKKTFGNSIGQDNSLNLGSVN